MGLKATSIRSLEKKAAKKKSRKGDPSDSEADDEPLRRGDRIEGQYKGRVGGKWYPGKISRINADGTYEIAYDDGGRDSRLRARFVRREGGGKKKKSRDDSGTDTATEDDFARGGKVEANYKGKGKWYAGEIARVKSDDSEYLRGLFPAGSKQCNTNTCTRKP